MIASLPMITGNRSSAGERSFAVNSDVALFLIAHTQERQEKSMDSFEKESKLSERHAARQRLVRLVEEAVLSVPLWERA